MYHLKLYLFVWILLNYVDLLVDLQSYYCSTF